MKLPTVKYPFVFLTPCFSGTWQGKEGSVSELRIPAIRGHLRGWHREIYRADDANCVWGSTAGNEGCGSRVGVTLENLPPPTANRAETLPHKSNVGQRGSRAALPVGTKATLVLRRLPGCTNDNWTHAQNAAKLWLLLGTLGNRANRAAGSVWPDASTAPGNATSLRQSLDELGCKWAVKIAPESVGTSWEPLRKAASDTPSDRNNYGAASNPRTPSPTRFKVVSFGQQLRLIIFATTTERLTAAQAVMERKPVAALSKPREWARL